ncbi:MAG: glycosyltransferase family 39 protein [Candidatus Diapherotrites archaeon]|nr:glycosyltransferase family 39 protein [Candidatus Diapherotrites archaeon]
MDAFRLTGFGLMAAGLLNLFWPFSVPFVLLLANFLAISGQCVLCTPLLLNSVSFIFSLLLLGAGVLLAGGERLLNSMNRLWSAHGKTVLILLIVVLASLMVTRAFLREADWDEFEHIHSAWHILQGHTPYVDFFQHHNSFFHYLLAPFLLVSGESAFTFLFLRALMLLSSFLLLYVLFRFTRSLTELAHAPYWTLVMALSFFFFHDKAFEVRPDVPMALAGVAGFYFLMRFFSDSRKKDLWVGALLFSLSVLFLQKGIFFVLAAGLAFLWAWHEKRVMLRDARVFGGMMAVPLLLYLGFIWISGSLNAFLIFNVFLNLLTTDTLNPFIYLKLSFIQNASYWVLAFAGVLLAWRKNHFLARMVSLFFLVSLASLFLVKVSYMHYYLSIIPFAVLAAVYALSELSERINRFFPLVAVFLIGMLVIPAFFGVLWFNPLKPTLERVQFVLDHSTPSDYAYDSERRFNLFRPDTDFFWYAVPMALPTYREMGYAYDYNAYSSIARLKPKFISTDQLDLGDSLIRNYYRPTPFPGLLERIPVTEP